MASNLLYPEDDFELLIFLSLLPECWNYKYNLCSLCSQIKDFVHEKKYTNGITFPVQNFYNEETKTNFFVKK